MLHQRLLILLRRGALIGLVAVLMFMASGCAQIIQPYRGLTKAGAEDPVIRKYKIDKHTVEVYIVTVTTYTSGGGASTQSYRLYEVSGFNYSLPALKDYFLDSGQPKAAAEMAAGLRITSIGLPAIYVSSIGLIAAGFAANSKASSTTSSGSSSVFSGKYNWGMIGGGAVIYFAGPWLLDMITWEGYIAPSIELFNKRLKKDIQVTVGIGDEGPSAALAWRF